MHVGGIRTALFAYLVARQSGGQFILRLEDTDKNREVEGSAQHIIDCLNALELDRDEGVQEGGDYGPYIQSERLDIYKSWARKLIDSGRAYADPYTSAEVQKFREQAQSEKRAFLYRHHRPEITEPWDGTTPLRFKSDPKSYDWTDAVMGELSTGPEVIDDFILIKSDGYPTYNFAHIVDDAEMGITHVIRGQEFISSQPNYLNLYEALNIHEDPNTTLAVGDGRRGSTHDSFSELSEKNLGADRPAGPADSETYQPERSSGEVSAAPNAAKTTYTRPIFATMPPIMNDQGNKKLGKRDGAKDLLDYIREGYLPETMLNFIATLGWNDGTEQEIFSKQELIEKFSLNHVQRSGARFDQKRLEWMNGQYIRALNLEDLSTRAATYWTEAALSADKSYRDKVLALIQDRLRSLEDVKIMSHYFFAEPEIDWSLINENKQLKKLSRDDIKSYLTDTHTTLETTEWNEAAIQDSLNTLLETTGQKPGILFSLVRIATTWAPFSPQLNLTLELLGKETTLARLKSTIEQA